MEQVDQQVRDHKAAELAAHKEARKKIKQMLQQMNLLSAKISELLKRLEDRRHIDDRVLRSFKFIQFELVDLVATLDQLHLPELDPDYVDVDLEAWLRDLTRRTMNVGDELHTHEQAMVSGHGCGAQLQRVAGYCFCHDAGAAFPAPDLMEVQSLLWKLYLSAGQPCRYKHLLLIDSTDHTSRSSRSMQIQEDEGSSTLLVGIECTLRNKLLRWFMQPAGFLSDREDSGKLKVVCFVGPAGVGKTALAMEVFRRLQITGERYLHYCITAKVSNKSDPEVKKLLWHVLSQIDEAAAQMIKSTLQQFMTLENEQALLVRTINNSLKGKRYLIMIDDIWKESDWDIIKSAIPQDSQGSWIMITTRIRSLARYICYSGGYVHEVKPLNELDSERLLLGKAFGLPSKKKKNRKKKKTIGYKDGSLPDNLKQCFDEILRRCAGIPLFLSAMAHRLREQHEMQHISTNYCLTEKIQQALSDIYDDLPYLLKVLLLYMSMYPEGYMFEMYSLIEKWMAEGMIDENDPKKVEGYVSKLIDRNVIARVEKSKQSPTVTETCHWQINYFMLQFLASKSAEKGIFFTSGMLTSVIAAGNNETQSLRRMSFHTLDPELEILLKRDVFHTCSLAISGMVDEIPLSKFIHLVVLDLEGWQCFKEELLPLICCRNMFLLRYLSLSKTCISVLPPEIKELRNLQTLDISHTNICELPSEIKELRNLQTLNIGHTKISELQSQVCELSRLVTLDLRNTLIMQLPEQVKELSGLEHLLIGGDEVNHDEIVTKIPEEIMYLKKLLTLATVDLSECSTSLVEALGRSKTLDVLAITWSFHQSTDGGFKEALRSSIKNWSTLKSLTIHCGLGCSMEFLDSLAYTSIHLVKFRVTGGRFVRIPRWFSLLDCLVYIEVTVCRLESEEDLTILRNLPSLECLVLGLHSFLEEAIVIDSVGFTRLQRLSINCLFPWLIFEPGSMPEVTYLELKIAGSPVSQENIPSGICNLMSLSEVSLHYNEWHAMNHSVRVAVEAVKKGAAEHVNAINIIINGIQFQEEYVQEVEEVAARATKSHGEIKLKNNTVQLHDKNAASVYSRWYHR